MNWEDRMIRTLFLAVGIACVPLAALAESPIQVRPERPRIMLRETKWDGPSVEQIRARMALPEYKQRAAKLNATTIGEALLWMVNGDEDAGHKAVAEFIRERVGGDTPTNWGDSLLESAVLYDWLHNHPDFTAEARKAKVADFEKWGDKCVAYFKNPETPFYCRYSAMLSGFATMALAIDGDSPKAADYLKVARDVLCNQYGTIRQMEDGATGGGGYGYNWQFRHLAAMAAAWRSASDFDAPK
jgi:hypothetical protein